MANSCTKRLAGKIVFITGAAQGIGRATALRCDDEGAEVIATDLNFEKLKELQSERSSIKIDTLDVTKSEDVKAMITEKYPQLNVLFNCAGYVFNGTIETTTEKDWDRSFDINVKSMFCTSQTCIKLWKEKGVAGNIINMASVASSIKGATNRCVYGATKAAVIGLTKSIAIDYVGNKIRCNAICPGTIDTPSLNDRMKATGDYDKSRTDFITRQKLGRLGAPEEVASMFVYLASNESNFVTGTCFTIDGGWSI
ncbi:dehydrogenase/reductase SDR family member 6-like [Halichondria panicea]|uniref:dehydrogenase/reductase SDR family member 6-like n=1 Tax=Halichondria panicea TaxID=6063 RepID=UPI00312B7E8D